MSKLTSAAPGRPPRTVRRPFRLRRILLMILAVLVLAAAASTVVPTKRWADGSGYVMTDREVEICPSVEGAIDRWEVSNQSEVKRGDMLIQLNDLVQHAAHQQAMKELEATKTAHEGLLLRQKLERSERQEQQHRAQRRLDAAQSQLRKMLSAGRGFSTQEIDQTKLQVDLASSELKELRLSRDELWEQQTKALRERIEAVEKKVALHAAELQQRKITAALGGTVQFNSFEPGEVVKTSDVLGQIFDRSSWVVKLKLPERYIMHVKEDQPVRVELAAMSSLRYGYAWATVSRVTRVVSPQATGDGIFYVEARIKDAGNLQLHPGMKAAASINTGRITWMYRLLGW